MERLTYRLLEYHSDEPNGYYAVKYADTDYEAQDVINRLADYEDRNLIPEEIDKLKYEWAAATALIMGYSVPRLQELAKADKDERVVVLPCKVGDMLYETTGRGTISVYKVKAIRVELFSLFVEWDIVEGFVWQYLNGINAKEIGKTVFLTREEAEAALEAMKDA